MRNLLALFYVVLALIIYSSCNKNADQDIATNITGTWELREKSGGLTPTVNYPTNNGNLLKFTDTSYKLYRNGQLTESGKFTITPDATAEASVCMQLDEGKFEKRIQFHSSSDTAKVFIDLRNNQLTLISGCYAVDAGHSSVYAKISESSN